ncbi:hypothetical protein TNCV_591781, partial [Trichonephila clavipes]
GDGVGVLARAFFLEKYDESSRGWYGEEVKTTHCLLGWALDVLEFIPCELIERVNLQPPNIDRPSSSAHIEDRFLSVRSYPVHFSLLANWFLLLGAVRQGPVVKVSDHGKANMG